MTSWKTTAAGAVTAAGATLMGINSVPMLKDAVPDSIKAYVMLVGFLMTTLGPLFLGLCSRDNNVTSEQAGATKTEPKQEP